VKGEGNQQDYGIRVYDPRLGRFLSVDPLSPQYPELTPYQYASNTPIWAIDIDGLESGVLSFDAGENISRAETADYIQRNVQKKVSNWWNSPSSGTGSRMAYSWYTAAGIPADVEKKYSNGDVVSSFLGAVGRAAMDYYSGRFMSGGGLQSTARTAPQAPEVEVTPNTSTPKLSVVTAEDVPQPAAGNVKPPDPVPTATVSRAQGGIRPNFSEHRFNILDDGQVRIRNDKFLFIVLDDEAHSLYFYNKRGGSEAGAYIASFKIPKSLADEIRNNAVPQSEGKTYPNSPQVSDPTKSPSGFGLPLEYINKLREQAIQGSGTKKVP
jgi:hypothetical protein